MSLLETVAVNVEKGGDIFDKTSEEQIEYGWFAQYRVSHKKCINFERSALFPIWIFFQAV